MRAGHELHFRRPDRMPTDGAAESIAYNSSAGRWVLGVAIAGSGMAFLDSTIVNAASVILVSSHVGYPLSTTQVVSGAVTGSGVGRPGAVVNWLVARGIVAGWLLTLPSAAAVSMVVYAIIQVLGGGVGGTVVVSVAMISAAFLLWRANRAQPVEPEERVTRQPALGPAVRPEAAIA